MTKEEAAKIIDAISQSVEKHPDQFHLKVEVTAIGTMGQASAPGSAGVIAVAHGGGPGSITTGLRSSVSMDNAQLKIARQKGEGFQQDQLRALVDALNEIAAELRVAQSDHSKLTRLCKSLENT